MLVIVRSVKCVTAVDVYFSSLYLVLKVPFDRGSAADAAFVASWQTVWCREEKGQEGGVSEMAKCVAITTAGWNQVSTRIHTFTKP